MKIFGMYFYVIASRRKIDKQKLWALARGLAHLHENPIRKPLLQYMRKQQKKAAVENAGVVQNAEQ